MKALVTGGGGLVGRALLARLPDAIVTSRRPAGERAIRWLPDQGPAPLEGLERIDAVFHLAGEPVADGRWTAERKKRIRESRVAGTRNLVAGLAVLDPKPQVLVSASAIGYYGDRGDDELDEASSRGHGFLADVCAEWEDQASAAERLGIRVVCARIGIVLAAEGGALSRMSPAFKLGAGARLGDGRQWMSWIHLDDVIGLLLHASRDPTIAGPLNVVSPQPVTNADFTRALGRAVRRPTWLSVPNAILRLGLGEMSELLTASQRVMPRVAERTGYAFVHPDLESALAAALEGS